MRSPCAPPKRVGQGRGLPSVLDAAVINGQSRQEDRRSVIRTLELAPLGGIEAALARLGRAVLTAGK